MLQYVQHCTAELKLATERLARSTHEVPPGAEATETRLRSPAKAGLSLLGPLGLRAAQRMPEQHPKPDLAFAWRLAFRI